MDGPLYEPKSDKEALKDATKILGESEGHFAIGPPNQISHARYIYEIRGTFNMRGVDY